MILIGFAELKKYKNFFCFQSFSYLCHEIFQIDQQVVKQRIIEEASRLFGRSGVKSITMDDLARHLGISKRTIYENFRDKETLLIACIDTFQVQSRAFSKRVFLEADNVAEAILVMLRKDAEHAMQRKFSMIEEIRKYYPHVFKELLTRFQEDKCSDFEQILKRGIKEGVFRENLNSEIIVHFFCMQADDIAQRNDFFNRFSRTDVFENLTMTFLRGICTEKGLEIIGRYKEKVNYQTNENAI